MPNTSEPVSTQAPSDEGSFQFDAGDIRDIVAPPGESVVPSFLGSAALEEIEKMTEVLEGQIAQVHERISAEAPSLYEATLPDELEKRLGGASYALGFNQSDATTAEEATKYLESVGGVDLRSSPINMRFRIYSKAAVSGIDDTIDSGYYGTPDLGRFVVTFPASEIPHPQDENFSGWIALNFDRAMPQDAIVDVPGKEDIAIGSKYVAGFIDKEGAFWANNNFCISGEPDLVVYDESATK